VSIADLSRTVKPVMLDLCAGLGGASQAMRDRNWSVVTVDTLDWLQPSVVGDVRALPLRPFACDLIWSSPPCTEFSRKSMPWFPLDGEPDMSIYHASKEIIETWKPRYWVIENVRGAVPYFGAPTHRYLSHYLWTNIPLIPDTVFTEADKRKKLRIWGGNPLSYWQRSLIPYELSAGLAGLIECL
jgi:hypothetical protein